MNMATQNGVLGGIKGLAIPAAIGAGVGAVLFGVPILAGAVIGAGAVAVGRALTKPAAPTPTPIITPPPTDPKA
jgi:hypothetical protein